MAALKHTRSTIDRTPPKPKQKPGWIVAHFANQLEGQGHPSHPPTAGRTVVQGITDLMNLGSLLRSAAFFGVQGCPRQIGPSPTPLMENRNPWRKVAAVEGQVVEIPIIYKVLEYIPGGDRRISEQSTVWWMDDFVGDIFNFRGKDMNPFFWLNRFLHMTDSHGMNGIFTY